MAPRSFIHHPNPPRLLVLLLPAEALERSLGAEETEGTGGSEGAPAKQASARRRWGRMAACRDAALS